MITHIQNTFIISIAYIVSFSLTMSIITPLQSVFLAEIPPNISILFLPHGVRVLSAYYFGWKSILYLLPSSYFMYFLMIKTQGNIMPVAAPMVSIFAAYVGVKLISLAPFFSSNEFNMSAWKWLLLAGFFASIFNGLGLGLLQSEFNLTLQILGYAIGDVSGQLILMICLIYYFRYIHRGA